MDLKLAGDLALWQGLLLAVAFAGGAWWLYRRDVGDDSRRWLRWLLPTMRCAAIVMTVLALVGPVLRWQTIEGRLGRVLLLVDGSQSMGIKDAQMDNGRKLQGAIALGMVDPGKMDPRWMAMLEKIDSAHKALLTSLAPGATPGQIDQAAKTLATAGADLPDLLAQINPAHLASPPLERGSVTAEYFDGLQAGDLDSTSFVASPATIDRLTSLESAANRGDYFATRVRAFLYPPETGSYTFYLTADDQCRLLLGESDSPASRRPIISLLAATSRDRWDDARQKSAPITLEAGKRYYLELLHRENSGDDHFAVGWQTPSGRQERPIPGLYLSPIAADPDAATGDVARKQLVEEFRQSIAAPARLLAGADLAARKVKLAELQPAVARYQRVISDAFARHATELIETADPSVRTAVQTYAAMSRWQRAESLVLDREKGLLAKLATTHQIEIAMLADGQARRLWSSTALDEPPDRLPADPASPMTDLSNWAGDYLDQWADADDALGMRTAAVLLSDGRHNDGASPIKAAQLLGNRRIPIHTITYGNLIAPPDLSLLDMQGPNSVYKDDRINGHLMLADHMPAGKPFTVKITEQGELLWERTFQTSGSGRRRIDFDFSIAELMEKRQAADQNTGVENLALPLSLKATIAPIDGEARAENNTAELPTRALSRSRKLLIIDGRPRWETRFVRNLFERDRQWKTSTLIARMSYEKEAAAFPRGDQPGAFPRDRQALFAHDLIIFGDLPPRWLTDEEQGWITEFVEKRAGGVIFMDGKHGNLQKLSQGPLGPLLPVQWTEGDASAMPERLSLTDDGRPLSAFRLDNDSARNIDLWSKLPQPHWVAPVKAQPGALTLVESIKGQTRSPAMVFRRYGAGQVLYMATDETWRWRYEVGDLYHQRFWNQIADWMMEPPYAVQDAFVTLDVGSVRYMAGESAAIRTRLRDRDGKPLLDAKAVALVYRDGKQIASLPLSPDENRGGVYRAATARLAEGEYEIGVRIDGFSELETKAKTRFTVKPRISGEMSDLTADESLMLQMAQASGGQSIPEEKAQRLADLLAPLSDGKILISETPLAQSYGWLVPIIMLLTLEWVIRKRAGML